MEDISRVRHIETEIIDKMPNGLRILQMNRYDALQLACQVFEWYVLQYKEVRNRSRSLPYPFRRVAIERMLDCHQGLDILVRWIFKYCPIEPCVVPDKDKVIVIGTEAFDSAIEYSRAESYFISINYGLYAARVMNESAGREEIEFTYPNQDIAYYETVNKLLLDEYNSFKFERYRAADNKIKQSAIGVNSISYYSYGSIARVMLDFDLPDRIKIGKYTIGDITEVWYKVLRQALHRNKQNEEELIPSDR